MLEQHSFRSLAGLQIIENSQSQCEMLTADFVREMHFVLGSTGCLSLWDLGDSDGLSDDLLDCLENWVAYMEDSGASVDVERETSTLKAYSASGGEFGGMEQMMVMNAILFNESHSWQIGYSIVLDGLDCDPSEETETILKILESIG